MSAGRKRHPRRLDQEPPRTTSKASRAGVASRACQGANTDADQPGRDHLNPQEPDRGPRHIERRADRGRDRAVGRRRHLSHPRARKLHVVRDARAAPGRHRAGAQPRVRQRRCGAVRRVGADLGGRHGQAHRAPAGDPGRRRSCWGGSSTRSATRSTARARSTRPRPARPSTRRRASSSASRSRSRC